MQVGLIFLSSMADSIASVVAGAGGSAATAVTTALVGIAAATAIVGALTIIVGARTPAPCRFKITPSGALSLTAILRRAVHRALPRAVICCYTIVRPPSERAQAGSSWRRMCSKCLFR